MRLIGLHIRTNDSLCAIQERINFFGLSVCQIFVVAQQTGKLCIFSDQEIKKFSQFVQTKLERLYVHGSYWINLSSLVHNGYPMLRRECALAKRLGATHFIIHPGTAKGTRERMDGIDALAQVINTVLKGERDITIVLENTAHGKFAVGSDIQDFYILRQKLDIPERLKFCIDTAHAYAYGYDIVNLTGHHQFMGMLDAYLGLDAIELIHLNDTRETCGSKIDCHEIPGAGRIGSEALIRFCSDVRLTKKPIILELPVLTPQREQDILTEVRKKILK